MNNNWSAGYVAPSVSGTTSVSSLPSGGVAPVLHPTYTPTIQARPSTATVTPGSIAPASIAPVAVEPTTYTGYNTYATQPVYTAAKPTYTVNTQPSYYTQPVAAQPVATSFKPTIVQPTSVQPTYTYTPTVATQPTYNYGSFVPAVPVD